MDFTSHIQPPPCRRNAAMTVDGMATMACALLKDKPGIAGIAVASAVKAACQECPQTAAAASVPLRNRLG